MVVVRARRINGGDGFAGSSAALPAPPRYSKYHLILD